MYSFCLSSKMYIKCNLSNTSSYKWVNYYKPPNKKRHSTTVPVQRLGSPLRLGKYIVCSVIFFKIFLPLGYKLFLCRVSFSLLWCKRWERAASADSFMKCAYNHSTPSSWTRLLLYQWWISVECCNLNRTRPHKSSWFHLDISLHSQFDYRSG